MGDPTSEDYYKVLGVAREATEQEISKAYKKAAIRWHPDKNQGDPQAEENFKKVAEAYDCLSNKDKRAAYNRFGKEGLQANGMGGPGASFNHAQAEEIFKTFFGGADPFEILMGMNGGGMGGGMPGGFGCQFAGMEGGGMPGGGPRMMFSSMGGMPGGMGFGPGMAFGGMQGMGGMPGGGGGPGMGGRRHVRPRKAAPRHDELPPKTAVTLSGLQSAAHQNGKTGRVMSFDPQRGRYTVQLDDGDTLSVRLENLHQIVDVVVTDVSSAPQLNGTKGTILSMDEDKDRYHVRLHDARVAALTPANVVLPLETRCRIVGLESAAAQQHNGKVGKIIAYDDAAGRYEVMVSEGNHLKLKRENVRV